MRIFKVLVVLFAISFSNGLSLHGEEVVLQKVKKTIYFDWTFGARAGFGPSITWNFDDRIAMQAAQMVGFSSGYNSTTFGGLYYLSEGFSTIYTGLYYQNYYSSVTQGYVTAYGTNFIGQTISLYNIVLGWSAEFGEEQGWPLHFAAEINRVISPCVTAGFGINFALGFSL